MSTFYSSLVAPGATMIQKKVTKFGTGAHITLPTDLIGKEVYIYMSPQESIYIEPKKENIYMPSDPVTQIGNPRLKVNPIKPSEITASNPLPTCSSCGHLLTNPYLGLVITCPRCKTVNESKPQHPNDTNH